MSGSDSIEKFFEDYKNIQSTFLDFLNSEENIEENFNNLNQIIEDTKIRDCQHKIRLFLHMLVEISKNHHHVPYFFSKFERVLLNIKDDINKYFSNSQIFDIFKTNKRILLFLIEEKIMTVDEYFVKQMPLFIEWKYIQYFAPEIKPFMNDKTISKYSNEMIEIIKKEIPDNFFELRKIGENESNLCKLIREDDIKNFIVHVNKNNISLNSTINFSPYETNLYLFDDDIELIEYAAFFGSIQILSFCTKYEGVELKSSLWKFAIHGENAEIINLLEDNHINPTSDFKACFLEAIECHHNDIANFFLNNYLTPDIENTITTVAKSLQCYNFLFLNKKNIYNSFCNLCGSDYYSIVKILLACKDVNVNKKETVLTNIFQLHLKLYHSI